MKSFVLAFLFAMSAQAADVGVSISVGEPGFYGRIDIGSAPPPQVIEPRPIVVRPEPRYVNEPPIYLYVPPGHAKHWSSYCARYNACGRPVYFVRDSWYRNVYVPHYRGHREEYMRRGPGPREERGVREERRGPREERERGGREERERGR